MPRTARSGVASLPRYVRAVFKTRRDGPPTAYLFYTRYRNTPREWPSIPLPADAVSKEFAERYEICLELDHDAEGFSIGGQRLPNLRAADFWSTAKSLLQKKRRHEHEEAKDFEALITAFEEHEAYLSLAKSTKRGYDRSADLVRGNWAYDLPADLTTVDAQQAIDALGETPAAANQFRAYLSRLMSWGIPRGFSATNPVQFTEKIPGGEPWKPWPDWAFDIFFRHAPFHLLLPAVSVLFTGQRQSDILTMLRPKRTDVTIEVKAQKTGGTVWIPIHTDYRHWIAKSPVTDSTHLHLGVRGLPYQTTDGFRSEWQRTMNTEPFQRFRDERLVFHGLRKNAVINLLEVGCTENQVGAIVNMSEQMVRHYGQDVSLRALARDGMKLLEARGSEVLPAAMERERNTNWKPAVRIGNRWSPSTREEKG